MEQLAVRKVIPYGTEKPVEDYLAEMRESLIEGIAKAIREGHIYNLTVIDNHGLHDKVVVMDIYLSGNSKDLYHLEVKPVVEVDSRVAEKKRMREERLKDWDDF